MGRALLILNDDATRDKARQWLAKAPRGSRITFQGPKRTLPQNDKLHAILTKVAEARPVLGGTRMTTDKWKRVFMNHMGATMEYIPTLNGDGFFPAGYRTSELSVAECGDLITMIIQWADENGIDVGEPPPLISPT